ncbi:hypothetical protein NKH18_49485 [Streptomyces sp. M10(2022)]
MNWTRGSSRTGRRRPASPRSPTTRTGAVPGRLVRQCGLRGTGEPA